MGNPLLFVLKCIIDIEVPNFRSTFSTILFPHFFQSSSTYYLFIHKYVLYSYSKIINYFSSHLNCSLAICINFIFTNSADYFVCFLYLVFTLFHYECITSIGFQGFMCPLGLVKRKLEEKRRMKVKHLFFQLPP